MLNQAGSIYAQYEIAGIFFSKTDQVLSKRVNQFLIIADGVLFTSCHKQML